MSDSQVPSVSVVMPVKNEAKKIRDCIEGILKQTVPVKEIIVVDSGSTDGTQQILKEYPIVRLIEIEPSSFNHGATRNLGVGHATGEFVLLTVGDAKPVDNYWIQHLLEGFTDDNVAGVCGQQVVPHDKDKNPVEWFRPQSKPKLEKFAFTRDEFLSLPAAERKRICSWDDVTAMYRRSVMEKLPFTTITYGEDAIWAKDAILSGYAIVYNTAARVYHYHTVNGEFTFKRTLTTLYFRYKQFQYVTEPLTFNLAGKLKIVRILLKSSQLSLSEKWYWLKYNIEQKRAIIKASHIFLDALKEGDQALENTHAKYCGKPPIPVK